MKKRFINKVTAVTVAASLVLGTLFTGTVPDARVAEAASEGTVYPWTPASEAAITATGDYIADSYNGVQSGHVFESVTQERLLDILSSEGNYYIVFGGPEHDTSQAVLATINEQAKADGITRIYHFDPVIDGYQLDITDEDTPFKASSSVYQLWERILSLLPESEVIDNYNSSDTLLFAFSNDGETKEIKGSYSLNDTKGFNKATAKKEIAKVFRAGEADGAVVKSDIRTDYEFFKRVYNESAKTEIFTEDDRENFSLHQVNFNELIDILNSEGEL